MARCNECIHKEICQFYNALGCKVLCQECGFFINQADVVPKSEVEALKDDNKFLQDRRFKELSDVRQVVAREIFEEIESEIKLALESNYKAKREHIDKNYYNLHAEFLSAVQGKIDALRGIDDFIAELKKKYTKSEETE